MDCRAVRRVEEAQDSCLYTPLTSPFVTKTLKRAYMTGLLHFSGDPKPFKARCG